MADTNIDLSDPEVAAAAGRLDQIRRDLDAMYAEIEALADRRSGFALATRFQKLMTEWRGVTAKLRKAVASWLRDELDISFADMADELGVKRGTAGGMYLPPEKRNRT